MDSRERCDTLIDLFSTMKRRTIRHEKLSPSLVNLRTFNLVVGFPYIKKLLKKAKPWFAKEAEGSIFKELFLNKEILNLPARRNSTRRAEVFYYLRK